MTSPRKLAANRLNAARSTGPRTPAGKTQSSRNALAHGLRSVSPVLPGEDAAAWEGFRAGVVADLRPVGVLEADQANWIASLMWRRRRVVDFEVAVADLCGAMSGPLLAQLAAVEDGLAVVPLEVGVLDVIDLLALHLVAGAE